MATPHKRLIFWVTTLRKTTLKELTELHLTKKNNSSSSNYRPRRAITPDVLQSKDDECGSEMTSAGATPTIEPGANHKKLMKPKKTVV